MLHAQLDGIATCLNLEVGRRERGSFYPRCRLGGAAIFAPEPGGMFEMSETRRVGITPKSWTGELHNGVMHLGKRWYVVSAEIDESGLATGVRLDGPYPDHATAAAEIDRLQRRP